MTEKDRVLPKDDEELVQMWRAYEENFSSTANYYGVAESSVRKRVQAHLGHVPRPYNRIGLDGAQLYFAWLQEGGDRGATARLAARLGAKHDSVRRSIRKYLNEQEA